MSFNQDFPNQKCYASKLHEELVADPGITTPIDSVQYLRAANTTRIVWSTTPSSAEQTAAGAVVAAHIFTTTRVDLKSSATIVAGEGTIITEEVGGLWQVLGGVVLRPDFFAPVPSLFGRAVFQYRSTGGTLRMRIIEDKPGVSEVVVSDSPKILPDTAGVWTVARVDTVVPFRPDTNVYRLEAQRGTGALSADVRFVSLALLENVPKTA